MRIGIFDSGIGGINVLSCLMEKYPNNEYIFFGDTKNIPYGDKSKEELVTLACNCIDFLLTKNVDIIIIACGTVSSNCYSFLKKKYKVPIYDIISPTINFIRKSVYQNIGVIGTERTIESKIFNIDNKNIIMKATPSFVPIIENNLIKEKKEDIKRELKDFINMDVLVLGCTHYPLLTEIINDLKINTIDMGICLRDELSLPNNGKHSCELFFSEISVNLVLNVENILHGNYQIYLK